MAEGVGERRGDGAGRADFLVAMLRQLPTRPHYLL